MQKFRRGTVSWFSPEKRYGFIVDDERVSRFFHVADTRSGFAPMNGESVPFAAIESSKGPRAVNVRIDANIQAAAERVRYPNGRMHCPHCSTSIVPRVVFNHCTPIYSIRPFRAGKLAAFRKPKGKSSAIAVIRSRLSISANDRNWEDSRTCVTGERRWPDREGPRTGGLRH